MTRDICVVVPTVREHECVRAYAENAREHGFDLDRLQFVLVTEDRCETDAMARLLDEEGLSGEVFDGSARERWYRQQGIAEYEHVVPAASHAETSFGLLYLWAGDFEYGVFIDDDTLPHPDCDFFGRHLRNLAFEGEVTSVRSDERWVNDDVVASQGLWTNVPDLDAVRILMDGDLQGQARTRLDADDYGEDFVAAEGQYLTVCSMNLAFRREVVPAFYQLPMDDNPWDVGRFDDIWSGVFLKRACDVLGKQVYNGAPLCEHNKAPRSTFGDLTNEVPGLELNEHVWEIVDSVEPAVPRANRTVEPSDEAGADADSYASVYRAMADAMVAADRDYENAEFLAYVGEHMHDWLDALGEIRPGVGTAERAPADD
ncbi:alpha-1 4-glucan-protein synthase [Halobacteriales archaeon QH_3_68_24]|nr:MAG: alpha-1 4-glucan-protein synthase [Halobacteriales archaeon QH_3_68_24]